MRRNARSGNYANTKRSDGVMSEDVSGVRRRDESTTRGRRENVGDVSDIRKKKDEEDMKNGTRSGTNVMKHEMTSGMRNAVIGGEAESVMCGLRKTGLSDYKCNATASNDWQRNDGGFNNGQPRLYRMSSIGMRLPDHVGASQ